jgi:glycosyltransferase involved in cell wall biosynthesis
MREAMLFGVPVVATDVGHIRELIKPNWNGLLVRREDPTALAEAIQFTLDNPFITRRRVERAKRYVRYFFSHRRRVEAHLSLYKEIVESVSA